jgi:hypothetical protein
MILKRLAALFLAIALIGGVVYLGILSGKNAMLVPWFGIAAALVAPVGLSLLTYVFSASDAELVRELSKVPKIEELRKVPQGN